MSNNRSLRLAGVFALVAAAEAVFAGGASTGLIPLTELGMGTHQGFEGGLYAGGANTIPPAHLADGLTQAAQVVPRNGTGAADPNGWIVMITVGMSNTTHESGPFERQEDINPNRNARLMIVNGGQGGQTASAISDPVAPYWTIVDERLAALHMTPQQVQVAWIKEANAGPPNNFPTHAQELSDDLRAVVQVMRDRFPNLRLCYLSSRIYGGYSAQGGLNPEPQAYESGFSVKWLIEDQINGAVDLNFDPAGGPVEAPWLAWGPYLWADGIIPRAGDGLVWLQSDMETDNVHPSPTAEQKVADLLSGFFNTDPTAAPWYASQPDTGLQYVDALANAHVAIAQPTQNFGSSTTLPIASGASDTDVLVKFDVSGVTQPILFAKLSFRVTTSPGAPRANVRLVTDNSWTENAVTWNTAPAGDEPPVVNTGQVSRDGTISADVTQAVTSDADGLVSFRLSVPNANGVYHSREAGQPPRLILVVSQPGPAIPAVSTWGLIVAALLLATAGSCLSRRKPANRFGTA